MSCLDAYSPYRPGLDVKSNMSITLEILSRLNERNMLKTDSNNRLRFEFMTPEFKYGVDFELHEWASAGPIPVLDYSIVNRNDPDSDRFSYYNPTRRMLEQLYEQVDDLVADGGPDQKSVIVNMASIMVTMYTQLLMYTRLSGNHFGDGAVLRHALSVLKGLNKIDCDLIDLTYRDLNAANIAQLTSLPSPLEFSFIPNVENCYDSNPADPIILSEIETLLKGGPIRILTLAGMWANYQEGRHLIESVKQFKRLHAMKS